MAADGACLAVPDRGSLVGGLHPWADGRSVGAPRDGGRGGLRPRRPRRRGTASPGGGRPRSIDPRASDRAWQPPWMAGRPAAGSIRPWLKSFARPPPGCAKTGRDPTSRAARRARTCSISCCCFMPTACSRVAGHYLRGGMVAEAEPLLKRVLFIRERLLGPQHPDAARAFDAYAEALASTNRRAQPDLSPCPDPSTGGCGPCPFAVPGIEPLNREGGPPTIAGTGWE